jgi:hypothetical protein
MLADRHAVGALVELAQRQRRVEVAEGSQAPRDSAAFEVREALSQPGCPVCVLALRAVSRFIGAVSYEQVNDAGVRAELRAARGFCNPHAYRWLREARNVLGTAIIYRDVLQASLRDLTQPQASGRSEGGFLSALLRPHAGSVSGRCPACRAQHQAERRYLNALLQSLADPDVVAEFDGCEGLCRLHTLAAVRLGGPGVAQVVARARQSVEELIGQLSEVIRKEDYRFRHEARSDAEASAPRRAMAWAAGAEGLSTPPEEAGA